MTDILAWLKIVWPYILAASGGLVAFGGFIKLLLEIKRLKLQIQALESEVQKSHNLIRVASEKEIDRYTDFVREIDQKLSSTEMKMLQVPSEMEHAQSLNNAVYRLQKIIEKYSEDSERKNYFKQMEERRSSFRPNEIQEAIINIMKTEDISNIKVDRIRQQFPDVSKLKIEADINEMSEIGIIGSKSFYQDSDNMISSFRLSSIGTRFVSAYKKSPNK